MVLGSANVSSEEYSDISTANSCSEKMARFNEKYGTMFALDENNDEAMSFYSQMSENEFEEYFLDVKNNYENWAAANENDVSCDESEMTRNNQYPYTFELEPAVPNIILGGESSEYRRSPTVSEKQRYIYNASSNENSLNITADVNYSGGWGVYVDAEHMTYDSYIYEYPAYIADRCDVSVSSKYGACEASALFRCKLYVAEGSYLLNLSGGYEHYKSCVFTAGKGDIREYSTI